MLSAFDSLPSEMRDALRRASLEPEPEQESVTVVPLPHELVGCQIGRYRIEARIGSGGMGEVLRAVDERLGRTVALKVLPRSVSGNEAAKARFLQEARTTSRIDHPNVCTIFEGDEADDGRLFIAMAYYPGKTLAQRLEDGRELPVSDPQAIRLSESYLFTKFAVAQDYLILVDEERNGNVWVLDELPEL